MLKRSAVLLLIILMLLPWTAAAEPSPYAIRVNRAANTVTVYSLDEHGDYTVPVRAMVCSTARQGYTTPLGAYKLAEFRSEWRLMLDGTYGQYATCFKGHYLFHSICYSAPEHDAMIRTAYNNLGDPASMGCVRLQTIDAKWIFDNCPAGTPVTVYDDADDPGPLGKPEPLLDEIPEEAYNGWDPTDPAPGNPWRQKAESVSVKPDKLTLQAGETVKLTAETEPEHAIVSWRSSDKTVAEVDSRGNVTALGAGTAKIEVYGPDDVRDSCTVKVKGELLPYEDLIPGAWYYPQVRAALEKKLFNGVSETTFAPDAPMTRAMVVQVLYNMARTPKFEGTAAFEDVAADAWYHDAVAWASEEQLVSGLSDTAFAPDRPMTRQDLAVILHRSTGAPEAKEPLAGFSDLKSVASYAEEAMAWAVENGLLQGSGEKLQPTKTASRIETAVILQRYTER
ncbi:MAG: S-layer homology domain-containing protein [Oscillospiraceae bacterium]|nr:S-layer homology domain-containing protein [Oscillospiraceae bacterium]